MAKKVKKVSTNTKKSTKRKVLITLLVILIILVLFCIIGIWYIHNKLSKVNYVELKNIEINEGVAEELKGYRNVALFGVDARTDTYTGTRSDGIIIASINEETNEVKLTSIYRDTMVYIEGHGYDKITHAYAYGGPELAINTINKNFDLDIREFVAVNFDAVIDIVDAVGGIEINITPEEVTQINNNIDLLARQGGKTCTKVSTAGTHNLNGGQALAYARIRKLAGGDYKRTERMRDVLNAGFKKAKSLSIVELDNLANKLLPRVYTNVKENEIFALLPDIAKYNIVESEGWPYKVEGITLDKWYGVPVTLESNVKELHEKLFENADYEVSDTVKRYSEEIIQKTGYR
ncbi:MAG: LCP family protein [Clostridia bacterium]|nr:LCP family protein [Clostridia bacterium]